MKKLLALTLAGLALAGAVAMAGCSPRTNKANSGGTDTTSQQGVDQGSQGQPPAGSTGTSGNLDPTAADTDLTTVDGLLNGVDGDLAAAETSPEDAD